MEMIYTINSSELIGRKVLYAEKDTWKTIHEGFVQDQLPYATKIGGTWYFQTELNLIHVFPEPISSRNDYVNPAHIG